MHAPSPRSFVTGADSLQVRPPSAHQDSHDMQDSFRSQMLPFLPRLQSPVWLGLTLLCHRQPT